MTPSANMRLGRQGEQCAAAYLLKQGYKILACNYRTPMGEIDLVAEFCNQLVFVEVKSRRSLLYGQPYEAVTRTKQQKLRTMALQYMQEHNPGVPCRFDVLALLFDSGGNELLKLEHIKNAF